MILILDTLFSHCLVALCDETGVLTEKIQQGLRQQTEHILPMVDAVLAENGLALSAVKAIAFNRGPGAFNGIRINTAVAQALAFAHDIPCIAISSLQALAQTAHDKYRHTQVVSSLDARMQEVYIGYFQAENGLMQPVADETLLAYDTVLADVYANFTVVGDGATLIQTQQPIIHTDLVGSATAMAKLAVAAFAKGQWVTAQNALPVYLRHHTWKTLAEQKADKFASVTADR